MKNHPKNPRIALNLSQHSFRQIFSTEKREILARDFGIYADSLPEFAISEADLLKQEGGADLILSGWGAAPLTAAVLDHHPNLSAIIHGAGSIKPLVTDALLERNVTVTSAVRINAQPVAMFCLGIILTALKQVYSYRERFTKENLDDIWWRKRHNFTGGYYKRRIGLIEWGEIARCLATYLQPFGFEIFVDSPYFTKRDAEEFNATKANTDWIMTNCDVVSIHCADVPHNWKRIHSANLALMKQGAILINTARGRVVDEDALVAKLKTGDIWAFLDVSVEEPPPMDHPFYSLPNCILTPHVSGSIGNEAYRLGDYCLRELMNYKSGESFETVFDLSQINERA